MKQVNKYELRSKAVQEVMKAPPKHLIIWGNSIIILVVVVSLAIANSFTLPIKVFLPCKVVKIDLTSANQEYLVNLAIGTNIPGNIKVKSDIVLNLDNIKPSDSGRVSGSVSKIISETNSLECRILFNRSFSGRQTLFVFEGMSGTVQITTEHISLMRLFYYKLTSKIH